jgi:inner membrane protein
MMTITHLLVGSMATAAILTASQPEILLVGAIASLLPDIDISTSAIGRILFPISSFLEKRFAHRSATHSVLASGIIGAVSYGLWLQFPVIPINFIHALNIGYFAGWFLDVFTKSGVQMFYPSPEKWVCPYNKELRFSTASPQEYWLLVILAATAIWLFQVTDNGGLIKEFNKLIAAPSGVTELYNESGGDHLIYANIQGVYALDRSPIKDKFEIVGVSGNDFIVEKDSQLFKAGNDPDSTIITQRITGEVGPTSITDTESISFNEDDPTPLVKFRSKRAYVTGRIQVDDPESIKVLANPKEYQSISINGSTVNFSHAPIDQVINLLNDQLLIGNLSIKVINVQ